MKLLSVLAAVSLLSGCAKMTVDGVWERESSDNAQLSLFLPGTGQFCNEQPGKGLAFLTGFAVSSYIFAEHEGTDRGTAAAVAGLAIMGWSALDAYHTSNQFNEKGGRKADVELSLAPFPAGAALALRLSY